MLRSSPRRRRSFGDFLRMIRNGPWFRLRLFLFAFAFGVIYQRDGSHGVLVGLGTAVVLFLWAFLWWRRTAR